MCDKRNKFCFVCGLLVDKPHCVVLAKNKVVVEAYNTVFNRTYIESQWYEPEYACSMCCTTLKLWKYGKCDETRLPFLTPMTWHRQIFHKTEDCYFCQTNTKGHHYKTRNLVKYANVLTASKPVPREVSEVGRHVVEESRSDEYSSDEVSEEPFVPAGTVSTERHFVSNADFHDLVRDLGLSIRQTEVLGSRLKQWNLVESHFKSTFARQQDLSHFERLFRSDSVDNQLIYCVDIDELFSCLNHDHRPEDWRLFLDGSCKSLKAVLLHNENQLPSVPIAYATNMKETYKTMQKIIYSINYNKYQWKIVSDLKVLTILLGLQGGYTKYPCYFCEWDSRAKDPYERKDWPHRNALQIGKRNVLNIPLVPTSNIILPPPPFT